MTVCVIERQSQLRLESGESRKVQKLSKEPDGGSIVVARGIAGTLEFSKERFD